MSTTSQTQEPTIASIIFSQLGGRRFVMFTGAKDFVNTGRGLRFSIGRNKTSANRCEIIYDEGMDLYNVRFYRQSMNRTTFQIKVTEMKTYEGVYCDMLEDIFSDFTGMATHF